MNQSKQVLGVLKNILRTQGVTYGELAKSLKISESSVKRFFSSGDFNSSRMEKICQCLNLSFFELVRLAHQESEGSIHELTQAQEQALVEHPKLFWFFLFILNQHSLVQMQRRFQINIQQIQKYLLRLDQLGLIELREHNRFKPLVPKAITWRKGGPIERWLYKLGKTMFLESSFDGKDDFFRFYVVKFTEESFYKFRSKLESLAKEILAKSLDYDVLSKDSKRIGVVVAYKPMNFSVSQLTLGK